MKLSVSTLGCPSWTLDEIIERCCEYGYDAIELRGIGPDIDLFDTPDFGSTAALAQTRLRLKDGGLEVSAVDSSARFANPETLDENMTNAHRSIDLAAGLGATCVRVFGGYGLDGEPWNDTVRRVADGLREIAEYAASAGVTLVLETHDAFSTGASVAEVLQLVADRSVAALWDFHHPFHFGETPEQTAARIGKRTEFVHVKDSLSGTDGRYCLLGDGDIPVSDCLRLLRRLGYDGYVSVEWEKRWIPTLAEPEVAFPQYATALRKILAEIAG